MGSLLFRERDPLMDLFRARLLGYVLVGEAQPKGTQRSVALQVLDKATVHSSPFSYCGRLGEAEVGVGGQ